LAIALDLIMHGVGARSSSPGQVTAIDQPHLAELLGILQVAKTPRKKLGRNLTGPSTPSLKRTCNAYSPHCFNSITTHRIALLLGEKV
jgi:hypothetical protein